MTKSAKFFRLSITLVVLLALAAGVEPVAAQTTLTPITPIPATPGPQVVVPGTGFDAYATPSTGAPFLTTPAPLAGIAPWGQPVATLGADQPKWIHRTSIFGEALWLKARDSDVTFVTADPAGNFSTTQLETDYSLGYRVGGSLALDTTASIVGSYMHWESDEQAVINPAPNQLFLPGFPFFVVPSADASVNIEMDMADLDYRLLVGQGDLYAVNVFFGVRWASLEQEFAASSVLVPGDPPFLMASALDFNGIGPRFGVDAERHACATGFFLYGRSSASFLIGDLDATHTTAFPNTPAQTLTYSDERIVTILDIEAGVGWQSRGGRVRLNAGYLVSMWLNMPNTNELLLAGFTGPFLGSLSDMDGPVTFDGLALRATLQW